MNGEISQLRRRRLTPRVSARARCASALCVGGSSGWALSAAARAALAASPSPLLESHGQATHRLEAGVEAGPARKKSKTTTKKTRNDKTRREPYVGPVTTLTLPLDAPKLLPIVLAQPLPVGAPPPKSAKLMSKLLNAIADASGSAGFDRCSLVHGWSCNVTKSKTNQIRQRFRAPARPNEPPGKLLHSREEVLRHLGLAKPADGAVVTVSDAPEGYLASVEAYPYDDEGLMDYQQVDERAVDGLE